MTMSGPQGRQPEPQTVLVTPSRSAIFLVVTVDAGGEGVARGLLSDASALIRAVGFRVPEGELTCSIAVGSEAWDRLFGGSRPAELHPFRELIGERHHAISTPGDLLFHIRADREDLCFELAGQIMDRLHGSVTVEDEVYGFRYFDERDLLGFVDGTENPTGPAASTAAFIGAEDPRFAGGSYVIVQKYLHDLRAWNALPVEEQERVIGRSKLSDIELPDDVKPADSHVALNTITDPDGTERQIVRENMFLGDPPGNTDRILEFSTAVTGTLFFVPPLDLLDDPPDPEREGSLHVGSLKGSPSP